MLNYMHIYMYKWLYMWALHVENSDNGKVEFV